MKLIIVESPTKAKTLTKFLGKDYVIEASMGHVRDLPKSKLGVDVDSNFKADYVIVKGKKNVVSNLKKHAKKADEIILATDLDREGEAIAYHVEFLLEKGNKDKFSRIVFHEITKTAIKDALKKSGKVDMKLVDSQQTRRILDRLVGYKLSPILWRKVRRGLSAGRVQSVALRLIVEKEQEIDAFKPDEYWDISAKLKKDEDFVVELNKVNNKYKKIKNKKMSDGVIEDLNKANYKINSIKEKIVKKSAYPPFITSSLQRTAGNIWKWTAKYTMRKAQELYEHGLITYHRTDSYNLAKEARNQAVKYIEENFGKEYLPKKPNFYKKKSKNVQGAHEAIRPTNVFNGADDVDKNAKRLYDLIKRRFLGSQMASAEYIRTVVLVEATKDKTIYELKTRKKILKFLGWMKAGGISEKDDEKLPNLNEGDILKLIKVISEQKFTKPPTRYSESTLIKTLEDKGIGRPSTYASIVSTIQSRSYVEKDDGRLKPTSVGLAVTKFLIKYFKTIMDYEFTAKMENDLDKIAEGEKSWQKILKEFWDPFGKKLKDVQENAERIKIKTEKLGKKCPECKKGELVIRVGRYGKFISCSRFPECKYTANYKEIVSGVKCPECGGKIVYKRTKRGKNFYGCENYPKCKWASWKKPNN